VSAAEFAEQRSVFRITSEVLDVFLNPAQHLDLIEF
jgi:hypothetical protein